MATLFDPITVGKIELGNRIVMAPMTRARAGSGGIATSLMATYYAQRASAGLIISEAIHPCASGQGYIDTPGLHTREQIQSWRAVTDAVHQAGGRMFIQLQHAGRVSHPHLLPPGMHPVGPSAIQSGVKAYTPDGFADCPVPYALSQAGIDTIINDFATAAATAIDIGFDGVEIQGANGFLVTQFLNAAANQRTDLYGGSLRNRMRFPLELVEAVSDAVGTQRVGLRISPGNPYNGMDPADDESDYLAFVDALPPDLGYLHIAEKRNRPFITKLRDTWTGVLMLNPHPHGVQGDATDLDMALEAMESGVADLVSFGSLWVSNPDLPVRLAAGGPFNAVDTSHFYGGGAAGYTDHPTL